MTPNQFKNILCFLAILTGETPVALTDYAPEYVLEKYFRYISALPPDDDRWQWGLHPTLRRVLDGYLIKWSVDEPGMMDVLLRQP